MIKTLLVLAFVFAAQAQAAPCATPVVASCSMAGQPVCFDAAGTLPAEAKEQCEAEGGTLSNTPCAAVGRVLSCQLSAGPDSTIILRMSAPISRDEAMMACAQNQAVVCE
jgi:hypothetical protein